MFVRYGFCRWHFWSGSDWLGFQHRRLWGLRMLGYRWIFRVWIVFCWRVTWRFCCWRLGLCSISDWQRLILLLGPFSHCSHSLACWLQWLRFLTNKNLWPVRVSQSQLHPKYHKFPRHNTRTKVVKCMFPAESSQVRTHYSCPKYRVHWYLIPCICKRWSSLVIRW